MSRDIVIDTNEVKDITAKFDNIIENAMQFEGLYTDNYSKGSGNVSNSIYELYEIEKKIHTTSREINEKYKKLFQDMSAQLEEVDKKLLGE